MLLCLGMKLLVSSFILIILCAQAHAEFLTSVSYFQYSKNERLSTDISAAESLLTSYEFNFQVLMSSRYLIGFTNMTQSTSNSVRGHRQVIAPNIGFFLGSFMIEGGPISRSVERMDLSTSAEWREAGGYYVALTVYERLSDWLLLGFQFTYLDIEYKKYFDGSAEFDTRTKQVSVLNPSLRLSLVF